MAHQARVLKKVMKYWGAFLVLLLGLLGVFIEVGKQAVVSANPDDAETITIRLQTDDYTLNQDGLYVEGYKTDDTPGAPALPVWETVVELPSSGAWELSYRSLNSQKLEVQSAIPSVSVPALTPNDMVDWLQQEKWPSMVKTIAQPNKTIYDVNTFYPTSVVGRTDEQWQRGRRLLALRLFPFQYNPVSGTLLYHPDIEVTIQLTDVEKKTIVRGPRSDFSELGMINRAATTIGNGGAVRVYTTERGMYRLTYNELLEAGVPVESVDPTLFAISYLGEQVAIQVIGEDDGSFDAGDLIIFYAEPYQKRYMNENVYWFSYGDTPSPRMTTRQVNMIDEEPATTIKQTYRAELNKRYVTNFERPTDADHWFDNPLYPSNANPPTSTIRSVTYNLELDDQLTTGEVQLQTLLHGAFQQPQAIDNSIEILLNNQSVHLHQWDGAIEYLATDTVPASWLNGSSNQVKLTADLSQITDGPSYFAVYPDWVEITYPALADADGTDHIYIEGMTEESQNIKVTGFSSASNGLVRIYDLRDPLHPIQLTTLDAQETAEGYDIEFWDANLPNPTYFLTSRNALLAPSKLEVDTPSDLHSTANVADYIAIVHSSLWEAPTGLLGIDDLLNHREAEGLQVVKVDVQDVYDEFSYGQVDPEAIRNFLIYAYYNWNTATAEPPQYVLLVGDGKDDFKNHGQTPLLNLIPPYLAHIDPFMGEVPVDNRYVTVDGPDDYLPDMSIGRISAQVKWDEESQTYLDPSVDIDAIVHKIISYETLPPSDWQNRVDFVADNWNDPAGNFHALTDQIRDNWLPPSYEDNPLYYNSAPELDSESEMRAAIKELFNNDALLIQWFGHGSKVRWGSVSMFNYYDPEGYQDHTALEANTEWPLTASFACYSSYFTNQVNYDNANVWQSLGESMLRAVERGSVADIGPSGLHTASTALWMNKGVIEAIFQNRERRVGAALDEAKLFYWSNTSAFHDAIDTYLLLGDPAMLLHLPPAALENSTITTDEETPMPGQQVTFNVNLVNSSDNLLNDTTLTVDYDEDKMTINSAGNAVDDGDTLTWSNIQVPAKESVHKYFIATLNQGLSDGTPIETNAVVRGNRENIELKHSMAINVLPTATPTVTYTPSLSPSPTNSPTMTSTNTPGASPTATGTPTPGPSPTPTKTATITSTHTQGPSPTATSTHTQGPSPTATSTHTAGPSPTATSTHTAGPSPTSTNSPPITNTHTPSPSATTTITSTASRGAISGTVTSEDGISLEDIIVQAYRYRDNNWEIDAMTRSDTDGNYILEELEIGSYRIYFADPSQSYRAEYYGNTADFDDNALYVTVESDVTLTDIDAILEPLPSALATVSGNVTLGRNPKNGQLMIGVPNNSQESINLSVPVSCDNGFDPTNVTLQINGHDFPLSSGEQGQYNITINLSDLSGLDNPMNIVAHYDCEWLEVQLEVGQLFWYTPMGVITDQLRGAAIEGTTLSLYRVTDAIPDTNDQANSGDCRTNETRPPSTGGSYGEWSALPSAELNSGVWMNPEWANINNAQALSSIPNPLQVASDGHYGWNLGEGCWYIVIETPDYPTRVSPLFGVPPQITDLDIALSVEEPQRIYLPLLQTSD